MKRIIVKGKEKKEGVLFKIRENDNIVFKEIPFNNYIYINADDYDEVGFMISNFVSRTEEVSSNNGLNLMKLFLVDNNKRWLLKKKLEDEGYETFEADINAVKRFYIQHQDIPLNHKDLKLLYFDIETDDRGKLETDFSGKVIANSPVLSCAFKGDDGEKLFVINEALYDERLKEHKELLRKYVSDRKKYALEIRELYLDPLFTQVLEEYEPKLLRSIVNQLKKYDLTFTWYGWGFDLPFLRQRCEKHGVDFDEKWTLDIDYKEVYKKNSYKSLKSYSLENVALHEFGDEINNPDSEFNNLSEITKIDWREKTGLKKFFEMYLLEPELLEEYNHQDNNLMELIEKKLNYKKLQAVISEECHCPIDETVHNSKSVDYGMLNDYYNCGYVAPSKPANDIVEKRKEIHIGGGYTYCYLPGVHDKVSARDYKSFYPTIATTFNMSPETFVREIKPDLSIVFSDEEIDFVNYCCDISKDYLTSQGTLSSKKYKKAINEYREKHGITSTMKELMFRFVDKYYNPVLENYCKSKDYCYTPADINLDTRGWEVHPHRVFKNKTGVFPSFCKRTLLKRDEVKYQLKQFEYGGFDWQQKNLYQMGLKTLANSGYGVFALKSFRFFMKSISDGITSSCRFIMKKSILFAQKQGYTITFGDTDSCYMKQEKEGIPTMEEMDKLFYDYYDELVEPYNTKADIPIKDPSTGEVKSKNHFIIFEFEKELESVITIKKKRYYYKEWNYDANKFIYGTQGGAYKKSDTMPLAAELQEELCKDILDKTYEPSKWYDKIKSLKLKVESHNLDKEHIVMTKGINQEPSEYGGPVIDGKTGQPKVKKDGSVQQRPIPCHIKVASKMMDEGHVIDVGDKVDYVIVEAKPRQIGISLEEFDKNPRYDVKYYWERIESPLLEILRVADKDNVYDLFWDCWSFSMKKATKKQLESNPGVTYVSNERKREKLKEELRLYDDESEDDNEVNEE